jgi:hypothetical protein
VRTPSGLSWRHPPPIDPPPRFGLVAAALSAVKVFSRALRQ